MHLQRFLCPAVKASKFLCLAALSLTIVSTSVLSASSAEAVPNGELARIFSRQETAHRFLLMDSQMLSNGIVTA